MDIYDLFTNMFIGFKYLKIKEENALPGCSLRYVDNKERLKRKNLLLVDIKCSNVTESSENCRSGDSYLIYKCSDGLKFNNNQGIFYFLFFLILDAYFEF
jgi:hypothetical protein